MIPCRNLCVVSNVYTELRAEVRACCAVVSSSSRKSQVRHPVSHQQVPRVQAYFQARCKRASDQPLGCRGVLALNAKSVQLADGALHASCVPPHRAPGREDQVPESPERERARGPVVMRARCAHSTSCAQRSARGTRRRGRGERAARAPRCTRTRAKACSARARERKRAAHARKSAGVQRTRASRLASVLPASFFSSSGV